MPPRPGYPTAVLVGATLALAGIVVLLLLISAGCSGIDYLNTHLATPFGVFDAVQIDTNSCPKQ